MRSKEVIQAWLIARLTDELAISADDIDPHAAFDDLGVASRDAITLSGDLEDWLGRKLSPTVLWEYPSIAALSEHLAGAETDSAVDAATPAVPLNAHEPIAIVGIGLRFPGASSPSEFWAMMSGKRDAIRDVPADRWNVDDFYDATPGTTGKMYTRRGGFLDRVDLFDAEFFGISPREAARMDPQQRLLMETAWGALEDAGIAPDSLAGSPTGVYIGVSSNDYARLQLGDASLVDAYAGTGNAHSLTANRISYFLDLRGPSVAVDTACSSSLVALHAAVSSLRKGESTLALAGGVNLLLSPEVNMVFSHARMMSPDGKCKTFDAAADGYVRGEGCGVVVLKPLSSAVADGDSIYAVIRGTAINHDGRSNGLTAPNGLAQQDVIRRALADAGVRPGEIGYVEAHGTGTSLGDPIEVDSLKAVLLEGRTADEPCVLGSVKTNIGHLESAAGIAGLIKVALVLKHGAIPANLHFHTVNPLIQLEGTPLSIAKDGSEWAAGARRRIAGVSSLGFGGSNAHAIVEEAPASAVKEKAVPERPLHILALSAKSDVALSAIAGGIADVLEQPNTSIADVFYSANTGRAALEQRATFTAATAADAVVALRDFAAGATPKSAVVGVARKSAEVKPAFLFTGQGAQFPQMGKGLYETNPVFRRVMNECDEVLRPRLAMPLLKAIYPGEGEATPLDETSFTQPALFAIEYALSEVWKSWGVTPSAVMGHSVGEYVAACVAGVFTFEDGLKLIAERARLMNSMPAGGAMAAILTDRDTVAPLLEGLSDKVAIAALNGPANTVISGDGETVDSLLAQFKARGVKSVKLNVSHAFHSPLMDPMLDAFEQFASTFSFGTPRLSLVSNLIGRVPDDGHAFNAAYWRRHLREAVQFLNGVQSLHELGHTLFLEAGPQATLSGMGVRCVPKDAATWLPSLVKGQDDWQVMLRTFQNLYVKGARCDFRMFDALYPRAHVALPTYPFERKRYWLDEAALRPRQSQSGAIAAAPAASKPDITHLGEWLYQVRWQARALSETAGTRPQQWLVFADAQGVGDALAQCIRARGGSVDIVRPGSAYIATGGEFTVDPARPEHFETLWTARATRYDRVVHLWSLDAPSLSNATISTMHRANALGCGVALNLIKAIAASDEKNGTGAHPQRLLWCVTRGTQRVAGTNGTIAAEQAPIWGFGRSAAIEHAHLWGGLIDLNTPPYDGEIDALLAELDAPDGENQIALRAGGRFVARFTRGADLLPVADNGVRHVAVRDDATYLVTGGLGGLGLQIAKWLGERGAKHVVLLGRTPLPPREEWNKVGDGESRERIDALLDLESRGMNVRCEAVDVTNEDALSGFLASHAESGRPAIRGVIHAAGVLDDHTVNQLSLESLAAVMRPKVDGALLLHRHFDANCGNSANALDFFVMFSSVASVMGSPGQANYAAANAFMDALAHYRREHGQPALCINWGPWAEAGMAARPEIAQRLAIQGIGGLRTDEGFVALDSLLRSESPQVGVVRVDWDRLSARVPSVAESPLFSELLNGHPKPKDAPATSKSAGRAGGNDTEAIEAYLRRQIAQVLYRDEDSIHIERNFSELGLDSIMFMELVNSVERDLGIRLFPKELFDRPTIAELAPYLVSEVNKYEAQKGAAHPSASRSVRVTVPGVRLRKIGPAVRNKSAAFLLSAPRSGSTLTRVMLAGHPKLFSPPELHLLTYNSMREWREGIGSTYLGEGLQRALMELNNLDAAASREIIEKWVEEDLPVEKVYEVLQKGAGDRLLIDKSPSYGSDIDVLEHAERIFEGAKYIHLVRHPYSVVESFIRNRFEKILGEMDAEPMDLAEEVWTSMNANITDFLSQVDSRRRFVVKYEDIVSQPEETMGRLCEFLEVPFDAAVTKPYEGRRMTDGVHQESMGIGDPNFHKHAAIDPALGDVWKRTRLPRKLGGFARRVAAELEYSLPVEVPGSGNSDVGISSNVPHVVAIQPLGDRPPFFCCAPAGGMTYMYFHLPHYMGENQPIYGLQDPALNPLFDPYPTMQTLCAEQVKAIRKIQPKGPYYLGGWSFGGAVAFETAQQLMAAGEQVAFLAIIDTEARVDSHKANTVNERLKEIWGRLQMAVKVMGHWGPYARDFIYIILPSALKKKRGEDNPSMWEYITWMWADAIRHTLVKKADMAQVVSRDSRVLLIKQPQTRRTLRVLKANLKALLSYDLKPYHGPITLLRAEDQSIMHKLQDDWSLGWDELAKDKLDVIEVPGNHAVLLSPPFVERVGQVLRDGMDKAIAQFGVPPAE